MKVISNPLGGEASEYAHAYGIVCGMQSRMLTDKDFEAFIAGRGVSEIVATLEGTQYEPELQRVVGKQLDLSRIESALSSHFVRILREIISNVPEADQFALERIFIHERDLKNLKTVLRGVVFEAQLEEVTALFDAFGDFDLEFLTELAKSGSVQGVIEGLKGRPYHDSLKQKLAEFQKEQKILVLEAAMDLEYLDILASLEKETKSRDVRDYLLMQNEALVLRNLARVDSHKEFLLRLSGYYLSEKRVAQLLAGGDVKELLENTPYAKLFESRSVEVETERIILSALREASMQRPLDISSVLYFIKLKEREVKNLRAVIIGKSNELEPDVIRSLLI